MSKHRNYVFTLNNYTDADVEALRAGAASAVNSVKYLCFGYETGESGTPHLQGMLSFVNPRSLPGVKKFIGPRAHIEVMRGTFEQSAAYCKKDGNFVEVGELPLDPAAKGRKTQEFWQDIKQRAVSGDIENIDPEIYVKHYSTLLKIQKDHMALKPDLQGTCGVWIHGPTRIGKSRYARHFYPGFYHKMPTKWWDGYQGQDNVLIDDVDPAHHYLAYHLKIWMDRYSFHCESKGSSMMIRPQRIIVTSQYTPHEVFQERDADAILARCQVVQLFEPFVPPVQEAAEYNALAEGSRTSVTEQAQQTTVVEEAESSDEIYASAFLIPE